MYLGHEYRETDEYGLGAIEVLFISGFLPSTTYDPYLSQIALNNRVNRIARHALRL
jgi:hypothetical protein